METTEKFELLLAARDEEVRTFEKKNRDALDEVESFALS